MVRTVTQRCDQWTCDSIPSLVWWSSRFYETLVWKSNLSSSQYYFLIKIIGRIWIRIFFKTQFKIYFINDNFDLILNYLMLKKLIHQISKIPLNILSDVFESTIMKLTCTKNVVLLKEPQFYYPKTSWLFNFKWQTNKIFC